MAKTFRTNILSLSGKDISINSSDVSTYLRHDGNFINPVSGYSTLGNLETTGTNLQNQLYQTNSNLNESTIGIQSELNTTGNSLQNQINTIKTSNYITGVSITGGYGITGAVQFTGIGGLNIIQSGNIINFSGSSAGTTNNNITNNYNINSGSGIFIFRSGITSGVNTQFINFPTTLDSKPIVIASLHNDDYNNILSLQVSGTNTSGFWALLSASTNNTGYYIDVFSSNSSQTGMATNVIVNNYYSGTNLTTVSGSSTGISVSGNITCSGLSIVNSNFRMKDGQFQMYDSAGTGNLIWRAIGMTGGTLFVSDYIAD